VPDQITNRKGCAWPNISFKINRNRTINQAGPSADLAADLTN
jgi:hypothetical protein